MMRNLLVMSLTTLWLAACGETKPQAPTEGAAARTEMEAATKVYAECISGQAETMPVAGEAAGTLAQNAVKMCSGSRESLVDKVAAFNKIGYPKRTEAQLTAVAEASVKILEDEARQAAVVTIIKRQNETTGDVAPATEG